jgi:hypothetical protein
MRKTLAVLILIIGSILLLQAPGGAQSKPQHHLYGITTGGSYEALTNCPSTSKVRIRPNLAAKAVTASSEGRKMFRGATRNRFVFDTSAGFDPKRLRATCDGKYMSKSANLLGASVPLAFTGRSLLPQLLLGTGLLLVGGVFIVLAGFRRQNPRPATPG